MDARATECAWCGAALPPDRGRLAGRAVCERCGVATTDPWPSDQTLTDAYEGWYRPVGGRFLGAGDALLRRSRGALALRLEQIGPAGPVLDVGAGDGSLVDAIRARGHPCWRGAPAARRWSPRSAPAGTRRSGSNGCRPDPTSAPATSWTWRSA